MFPLLIYKEGWRESAGVVMVMQKFHNLPRLKPIRKNLRATMTPAEIALWKQLQDSQLQGHKFRRQHSIGNYVVDFYCPVEKLVVELDGSPHDTEQGYQRDVRRDAWLETVGVSVLRFENRDVLNNMEGVLVEICRHFKS